MVKVKDITAEQREKSARLEETLLTIKKYFSLRDGFLIREPLEGFWGVYSVWGLKRVLDIFTGPEGSNLILRSPYHYNLTRLLAEELEKDKSESVLTLNYAPEQRLVLRKSR